MIIHIQKLQQNSSTTVQCCQEYLRLIKSHLDILYHIICILTEKRFFCVCVCVFLFSNITIQVSRSKVAPIGWFQPGTLSVLMRSLHVH